MAKSKPRPAKKETVDPMEALRAKFNLTPLEEKSKEPDYSNYTGNEGNNKNSKSKGPKQKKDTLLYTAQAPYNFVPLVSEVLWGELPQASYEEYVRHIKEQGRHTGYLDINITAKTPIFVGGNGEKFFAPTGKPMLPGSSIRGMLKNIFKIVTAGAMRENEDIESRHLYFRGLAAKGSYGAYYSNRMVEMKNITTKEGKKELKGFTKTQPGFLIKIKGTNNYFICPGQSHKAKYERNDRRGQKDQGSIDWGNEKNNFACEIHTGKISKKFIYIIIDNPDWRTEKRIPVPAHVVEEYRNDKTHKGLNLLKAAKKDNEAAGFTHCQDVDLVVPCCYMAEKGEVQHFGHGQYYRIPYKKSVADHIPAALQEEDRADLADMIFGRKELWGSRVFVENAPLVGTGRNLATSLTHPLMSPNPTSFQLYLEQSQNPDSAKINHWDDNTHIRGYKLYWHQANDEKKWQITPGKDKEVDGMTKITPLAAGCTFQGRLRFSDLSDVELGALLEVFNLSRSNNNICFKLGMGKSIGLGSIALQSELHLIDSKQRYHGLFTKDAFATGDAAADKAVWEKYLDIFHAYLKANIQDYKGYQSMRKELSTMLDWQVTKKENWQRKMAYMEIGNRDDRRYRDRAILVRPSKYIL